MTIGAEAASGLRQRLLADHPGEAADELEQMPAAEAAALLGTMPTAISIAAWERLSPELAAGMLLAMPPAYRLRLLRGMDATRAAPLLAQIDEDAREVWLSRLPKTKQLNLRRLLSYPPDSAGWLMDPRLITLRRDTTAREALARLRRHGGESRRTLFLTDEEGGIAGRVEIQDLALAQPAQRLADIARPLQAYVDVTAPSEEILEKIEQQRLTSIPVVDPSGRLLGVVRQDALMAAAREDAAEDLLAMVGASPDERALSKVTFAIRKRLPWLQINLLTAFIAATVVGFFEDTIARFTALAVLLPVVAGQSGNTGAQAMVITMRGLALREIHLGHWPRILFKELRVGACNGIAVALTTSAGVYLWSRSLGLALVIATSMMASMTIAGLAGAGVPLVLTRLNQDPAQASSIILTTVTDVTGFFSFLGIATLLSALL